MGDPSLQLSSAEKYLAKQLGAITKRSSIYQTAAWGNNDQPDFLNRVIVLESDIDAETCMKRILEIEHEMGRIRTQKNAPRIIDIDILYFNQEMIVRENLVIPHPAIQDRRFVLIPLNELSPKFIHPVFKKSNHELLLLCKDELDVKKI